MQQAANAEALDAGLAGLALIANYYRIAADPAQLRHQLALTGRVATAEDLVRAANILGMKSRIIRRVDAKRIGALPYPAMIQLKDGRFAVLAIAGDKGRVRVIDSLVRSVREVTLQEAEELSAGVAILVTRRLGGAGVDPETFGFRWFWPSIVRYRKPLDARAGRLAVRAAVRAGDADLLPARGRQGARPQGHVDAGRARRRHGDAGAVRDGPAIPARLYAEPHHQSHRRRTRPAACSIISSGLPLAYFETRAAGQTVARMRELETIRSFLTGQGLTSLLDLVFTLVFIAVMFVYSVKLTLVVLASIPVYVVIAGMIRPVAARADQREVQSRRAVAAVPGRIDRRRADAEGGQRRADDAGAMGGAARRLCAHVVRRGHHRRARAEPDPVRQQGHDGADPLLRRAGGDRRLDDGRRTDRLQHDREPGRAADPAPVAIVAGLSAGAGVGRAARRYSQCAARARASESPDAAAAARGDRVPAA